LVNLDNSENRNRTTFTRCRHYGAESTLTFGDAPPQTAPRAPMEVTLAAGVEIPVQLTSRIFSPESAIGDPFTAEVSRDVKNKQGGRLLPKGAKVRGRVTYLEKPFPGRGLWLVAFRLEEFSFENRRGSLNAFLVSPLQVGSAPGYPNSRITYGTGRTTAGSASPPHTQVEPNQITVYRPRLDLRPGFAMTWRTR
jgi:hypothetical protein